MTSRPLLQPFLALSAELTGFAEATLLGTGMATTYHDLLLEQLGAEGLAALLPVPPEAEARRLIRLWYTGSWNGALLSPAAYRAGLLWRAIGVAAPGSRPPGYGSWTLPPTPQP